MYVHTSIPFLEGTLENSSGTWEIFACVFEEYGVQIKQTPVQNLVRGVVDLDSHAQKIFVFFLELFKLPSVV
jgi:hypothetical protein